jgi:hypothetical protein
MFLIFVGEWFVGDRLCGLVVEEFLATDAGVPGSIPGHYKKN